jgi:hypothetical protein
MRLPAYSTSLVAVSLALVTAFGMAAVRTDAPRERERVVRTTRGTGQRLDSAEAVLHSHEEASVLGDLSVEPTPAVSAKPGTDSNSPAAMPGRGVRIRIPAIALPMVPLQPTTTLRSAQIPPAPSRAPPSI